MTKNCFNKIQSIIELHELVAKLKRIIVDILRQIMKEKLPLHCKEKIYSNIIRYCK